MKKLFLVFVIATVLLTISAGVSLAAQKEEIINKIPKRYALLKLTGVSASDKLDKERITALAKEYFAKEGVKYLQYVIYDEGKKEGDGVRAFGQVLNNREKQIVSFTEMADPKKAKLVEIIMGYEITPAELYKAYSDDEVGADKDFRGKPLLVNVTVPQVSKDSLGKPYLKIPADKTGTFGLHVYLDKDDPNLRKIKTGSRITIRAFPKEFVSQSVTMDGQIIDIMN